MFAGGWVALAEMTGVLRGGVSMVPDSLKRLAP